MKPVVFAFVAVAAFASGPLFLRGVGVSSYSDSAADITPEIKKNFVDAETFIDEEKRPWRPVLRGIFLPLVKDCRTRREAIVLIATKVAALTGAEYDTRRRAANQSPAETLESKKATCTGLSLVLAAAYRSVGIPARIAGVAQWGADAESGNHTWVEVLDTAGWHFIDYYPNKDGYDRGWILGSVLKLCEGNPLSRVMAIDPAGDAAFIMAWDNERKNPLRAVDRTTHYQKMALEQGYRVEVPPADSVVVKFIGKDTSGERAAVEFKVIDGDTLVFFSRTPGPRDDINLIPRADLSVKKTYTVLFAGRKITVAPKAGEPLEVILSPGDGK